MENAPSEVDGARGEGVQDAEDDEDVSSDSDSDGLVERPRWSEEIEPKVFKKKEEN